MKWFWRGSGLLIGLYFAVPGVEMLVTGEGVTSRRFGTELDPSTARATGGILIFLGLVFVAFAYVGTKDD